MYSSAGIFKKKKKYQQLLISINAQKKSKHLEHFIMYKNDHINILWKFKESTVIWIQYIW